MKKPIKKKVEKGKTFESILHEWNELKKQITLTENTIRVYENNLKNYKEMEQKILASTYIKKQIIGETK